MPFACPLPFTRRVGQASVNRHVSRLTELRHLSHPVHLPRSRQYHVPSSEPAHCVTLFRLTALTPGPRSPLGVRGISSQSGSRGNDARVRRPKSRRKNRQSSAKEPSLKQALLVAAENGVAPPLHVDALDVSVTDSVHFDWAITVDEHYASHHSDVHSPATPGAVEDDAATPASNSSVSALQRLLAKAILSMANHSNPDSQRPATIPRPITIHTTAEDEALLLSQGYDLSDLHNWTTILTTIDSVSAARLLTGRAGPPESLVDDHSATPPFVYLYFLRRHHISPEALRILIEHLPTWHKNLASSKPSPVEHDLHFRWEDIFQDPQQNKRAVPQSSDAYPGSTPNLVFRACIRLLRHARLVWPESLPAIAEHLTSLLHTSPKADSSLLEETLSNESIAKLTSSFNRALHLISEPAAVEPFKSAVHREAAQAVILRHMAEHDPPLVINRKGYRAVARVQLAQPKTAEEAEWARLKSPSWPPWKEDRTGMDANVGLEYGVSRARHVLARMQEAGYAIQTWESVALIYAGWDSDLSPTIQTRAIMPDDNPRITFQVWAARIRSTRTVEQAWACFLSYEDLRLHANQDVYLAMFEKLVEERKRHRLEDAHPTEVGPHTRKRHQLLPGDAREVFPPPASIHQATYTKTPPPTVRQLHEQMLHRKLSPSGRTLAFLMNNAESLKEGLGYLHSSDENYNHVVDNLVYRMNRRHDLDMVPDTVFAATINLLMRFPHTPLAPFELGAPSRTGKHSFGPQQELDLRQPLARAIYLLDTERRQYLPSWNAILRGLARRKAPVVWTTWNTSQRRVAQGQDPLMTPRTEALDKLIAFSLTKQIISVMRERDLTLDVVGFRQFCIITEHAASAATDILTFQASQEAQTETPSVSLKRGNPVHKARNMRASAGFVRDQWWTLVGRPWTGTAHSMSTSELPRLLTTPGPAIIHAYIRALGLLQDYEGLQELVNWMKEHWPELEARRDRDRHGAIVFRRCIVALRVFLEGRWQDGSRSDTEVVQEGGEDEQDVYENDDSDIGGQDHEDAQVGAPRELLNDVWNIVDEVEDWGGWASEEEADLYVQRMKDT